jgi:hypothetical protein
MYCFQETHVMSMHAYSEKGSRDETLLLLAVAAGRLLEEAEQDAL